MQKFDASYDVFVNRTTGIFSTSRNCRRSISSVDLDRFENFRKKFDPQFG